jgi:hypothetical protein
MTIRPKFEPSTTVYHRSSAEHCGIVRALYVVSERDIQYVVAWDNMEEGIHQAFELTSEKPLDIPGFSQT